MKIAQCILISLLMAAGAACKKESVVDADVLARVGSSEIKVPDLHAELARRNSAVEPKEVLDDLIARESFYAAAMAKGLDRDPEMQRAWKNLLIGKLKERELQPFLDKAEIPAPAVAQYYQQNQERYTKPAQVHLAMLYVRTHPKMSEEKKTSLESWLAEARQRAIELRPEVHDFGPLAINYSEDQSTRYKGGDIGWFDVSESLANELRFDPQLIKAGCELTQVGAVSDLIRGKDGFYLVRLLERRGSEVTPLEKVEASIRHQLLQAKRKEVERRFAQSTRDLSSIVTYPKCLAKFETQRSRPPQNTVPMLSRK